MAGFFLLKTEHPVKEVRSDAQMQAKNIRRIIEVIWLAKKAMRALERQA